MRIYDNSTDAIRYKHLFIKGCGKNLTIRYITRYSNHYKYVILPCGYITDEIHPKQYVCDDCKLLIPNLAKDIRDFGKWLIKIGKRIINDWNKRE